MKVAALPLKDLNIRDHEGCFMAQVTVDQQRAALESVLERENFTVQCLEIELRKRGAADASWRAADKIISILYDNGLIGTCSHIRWRAL